MRVIERRSGLIPCGGPLRNISAPGVILIGDAAGWASPMTGGGIRLALRYGRRAASLIADHLTGRGPAPGPALSREIPAMRAKRLLRLALDRAPPNALVNMALATAPVRRMAERIYFHRRGADMDRELYLRLLDAEFKKSPTPVRLVENG
jgi:flavin-dependent dehydrogenase